MKILSRHMTMDLYNCKNNLLGNKDKAQEAILDILKKHSINCRAFHAEHLAEDHYAVYALFADGHLMLHVYAGIKYAAADIFMVSETPEPEKILKDIRELFKPDKTKSTFLKRGDFGSGKDIKPKTDTKVAPLRKIKSAGAKVIRLLVRHNK